ncbi:MAG: hypothetical protein IJJ69_02835 [Oscillospiraceae bacterium]|nr:hypothetical protein [Oscillospiraceae bacterium]
MKNITFFIILVCYFLCAVIMFDFIHGNGILDGGIFFVVSIIAICLITSICLKANEKYWDLFKKSTTIIMGIELILTFILRLCLIYKLSNM